MALLGHMVHLVDRFDVIGEPSWALLCSCLDHLDRQSRTSVKIESKVASRLTQSLSVSFEVKIDAFDVSA